MTTQPDSDEDNRTLYLEALVPLLAFGSTILGMLLWNAGMLVEIQYAAMGGFLGSCLLAYLAWNRPQKDIVALSTPIYGFIFLVTPTDYAGGVVLQLLYACGLTVLAARLHRRFGTSASARSFRNELVTGPLTAYIESTRDAFAALDPSAGHRAAEVFLRFSEGEYQEAAEMAHAAACEDGIPGPVVRAFSIIRQQAELLDRKLPRPLSYETFAAADSSLMAKPFAGSGDPERDFELQMDNALLLLFSAAWHTSAADRPPLLALQGFADKLLGQ
jgi:hypothetical protein